MAGGPAGRGPVAGLEAPQISVQRVQSLRGEDRGDVVEFVGIASEVVELALPVLVLDVEKRRSPYRRVRGRVSRGAGLLVGGVGVGLGPVVLDQDRVAPVLGDIAVQ